MASVNIPQRKQSTNSDQQLFQLGGAIAGGLFGGLPGAMAGSQLGGLAGGAISPQTSQPEPQAVESAMSRRVTQLDQTPLKQIRESIDSLKFVDPSIRAELAKPLLQAEYLAKQEA